MNRKQRLLPAVLLISCAQLVLGQDWIVPETEAALENPSAYTLENVKSGKDLYMMNCKSCHGDPGKNNPLALVPLPVDIASERMHLNTEGAIFYKISNGRGIMPPFKTTISEDDRWKLVNFIMNYKPGGEVLLVDAPPIKAKLLASVNEEKAMVEILAEFEDGDKEYNSLANAPVLISSKKAFGNIPIGRVTTNDNGRAEYAIPESLIGDEEGFVSIVVSLNDDYEAEEVALEKAQVGKLKEVPKLIRGEVLWSTNDNISLWLLLSYLLAAGGAWAIIGYVIYQIVKIKKYSKLS
ncbi:MAG: cytochrome c [Bacteroidota bacterium]